MLTQRSKLLAVVNSNQNRYNIKINDFIFSSDYMAIESIVTIQLIMPIRMCVQEAFLLHF